MNPSSLSEARDLVKRIKRVSAKLEKTDVVLCPPAIFISAFARNSSSGNIFFGAQDASSFDGGAHTAEIGADMIASVGAKYVIIGHSDLRANGQIDQMIIQKLELSVAAGLIPILCIGEGSRDESGLYLDQIRNQIKGATESLDKKIIKNLIVAYEPVWAIGKADSMRAEDIQETSIFIKKVFAEIFGQEIGIKLPILYGGSVNKINAPELLRIGNIDGLLVGRESVNVTGFIELLKSVDRMVG